MMRGTSKAPISQKNIFFSWVFLFLFKLMMAFIYCQMTFKNYPELKLGTISYSSGDHYSYMGAMENYIKTGSYYFVNYHGDTVRAGRSPHFSIPYWVSRQFFSPGTSADISTALNVLLDSFAILCMAIIAFSLAHFRQSVFLIAILLGALSTYISNWSFNTVPDGPAASLLMIGIYFFWKAYTSSQKTGKYLFFSSLFFSWSVVLRPYLLVVVAFFALWFLIHVIKRKETSSIPKYIGICLLPLLIFVLPWTIRNYKLSGRFIPFQQDIYAGYAYYPSELELRKLATSMGDDGSTFWDPKAMASYFYPTTYSTSQFNYPGYLKKDTAFMKKLERTRAEYISGYSKRTAEDEEILATKIGEIDNEYKQEHVIRFYIFNPIRRIAKFWGHSGSYYLPRTNKGGIVKLIILGNKLFQSALYYLALILGTAWLLINVRRKPFVIILLAPVVILTIFLPAIFGFMEPRYAMSFYYPCLIGLVLLITSIPGKNSSKKI